MGLIVGKPLIQNRPSPPWPDRAENIGYVLLLTPIYCYTLLHFIFFHNNCVKHEINSVVGCTAHSYRSVTVGTVMHTGVRKAIAEWVVSEEAGTIAKHGFDSLKYVGLPTKFSSLCV